MKKKSIYFSCLLLGCFASLFLATYWLNKNADTSTKKQLVSSSSSVPKFPYTSPNDPCFKHQWNLNSREGINVQSAWKLSSGENITIAVIDTGVAWVKDLSEDRFVPGKDYLTDESTGDDIGDDILTPQESEDSKIHGTFGTAIMAASTNNGIACAGIAYKSKVMPLRVLDGDNEPEKYEHIAEAIKFAVNNKADIINLSIEIHENDPSIKKAIEYAYKNNVVIVAAAGNQGQKKVLYPAFYKGVIAVGAYNKKGEIASYSNYSKDINIYAPGGSIQKEQCQELEWKSDSNIPEWASNGIVQLILRKTTQGNQIYKLGVCDGTSQATAHVTGVVALVKAILKPKGIDSPETILSIIEYSANSSSANQNLETQPIPKLDAGKAVKLAKRLVSSLPCQKSNDFPKVLKIKADNFKRDKKFREALLIYNDLEKFNSDIKISSEEWNNLCQRASEQGYGGDTMLPCEKKDLAISSVLK